MQSPNDVGTLFGEITLQRWLYEPLEAGERCLSALGWMPRAITWFSQVVLL